MSPNDQTHTQTHTDKRCVSLCPDEVSRSVHEVILLSNATHPLLVDGKLMVGSGCNKQPGVFISPSVGGVGTDSLARNYSSACLEIIAAWTFFPYINVAVIVSFPTCGQSMNA